MTSSGDSTWLICLHTTCFFLCISYIEKWHRIGWLWACSRECTGTFNLESKINGYVALRTPMLLFDRISFSLVFFLHCKENRMYKKWSSCQKITLLRQKSSHRVGHCQYIQKPNSHCPTFSKDLWQLLIIKDDQIRAKHQLWSFWAW